MKEYITHEELYTAYYHCRKNKRRKISSLKFELDYEKHLRELYYDLNNMTYEVSQSIVFGVTRPKDREVFAANFRDRVVHHLIMDKLEPILESEMIEDSYNCRKGKGTLYGVKRLQEKIKKVSNNYTQKAYCLSFDLKGFFMSIDKEICWQKVKYIMTDKWTCGNLNWWLWLVEKVIKNRPELNCEIRGDKSIIDRLPDNKTLFRSHGLGLPIGNLTSQIFGNYYLTDFDNWSVEFLGDKGEYARYVDDGRVVSSDEDLLIRYSEAAKRKLKEINATMHNRKWSIQEVHKGVPFIGSVITAHGIYTSNRTVTNALHAARSGVKDIKKYVQRLNSYFGFLIHSQSYAIRWNIYNNMPQVARQQTACNRMKKFIPMDAPKCLYFASLAEYLRQRGRI